MGMNLSADIWYGVPVSGDILDTFLSNRDIINEIYGENAEEDMDLDIYEFIEYLESKFKLIEAGVFWNSSHYYDDSSNYLCTVSERSYCGDPTNITKVLSYSPDCNTLNKFKEVCTYLGVELSLGWHISGSFY
jgi:hypothetical protein